jgi:hypothetical protein
MKKESLRDKMETINDEASRLLKMIRESDTDIRELVDISEFPEAINFDTGDLVVVYMLEELREQLGGRKILNEYRPGINVKILYIDLGSPRGKTIFYDFVEGRFLTGKPGKILTAKKIEGLRWLAHAVCAVERINKAILEKEDFYDEGKLREYARHTLSDMLEDIGGISVETLRDEETGYEVPYIFLGKHHSATVFYDSGMNLFFTGDPEQAIRIRSSANKKTLGKIFAEMLWEGSLSPSGRLKEKTSDILAVVREGDSVFIGGSRYYVNSLNKYFVNMYAQSELDALPSFPEGYPGADPIDWETLAEDPMGLFMAIDENNLPVTSYHLDLHDFWRAVVTNPLNSELLAKHDVGVSDAEKPYAPIPASNGNKFYEVGDRVFLDGERQYEIKAIGDQHIWYVETSRGSGKASGIIVQNWLSDFEAMFFNNQRNTTNDTGGKKRQRGDDEDG